MAYSPAIASSMRVPFIISMPINVMIRGEGGVTAQDSFKIGFPMMIFGWLLLALTVFLRAVLFVMI